MEVRPPQSRILKSNIKLEQKKFHKQMEIFNFPLFLSKVNLFVFTHGDNIHVIFNKQFVHKFFNITK